MLKTFREREVVIRISNLDWSQIEDRKKNLKSIIGTIDLMQMHVKKNMIAQN